MSETVTQAPAGHGVGGESPYTPRPGELTVVESMTDREKYFRVKLVGGPKFTYLPGQFVQVWVPGYGEAPISICSSPSRVSDGFEMCIRNVGRVTGALHGLSGGDTVGLRGPFGNGWPLETLRGHDVLFVAGGLGLAPARGAIQYVLDHRKDYGKVTVLYGARNPKELLFRRDLGEWESRADVDFLLTVDRGDESWTGHTGVITTLFEKVSIAPEKTYAVIVGPPIMFKFAVLEALSAGLLEHRILCSLERHMKCGMGKCGHCQVGHAYVCQDGPVFTYEAARRLREAM
jgi:sulfite reductase subunit B